MTEGEPDYIRDYDAPSGAITLSGSPRFGHTTDISSLMGSSEESSDYINGLVVAASITAICFGIAMLIVAVLFCCGRRNVGFLSGAPFEVTEEDRDDRSSGPHSLTSGNEFRSPPKERASRNNGGTGGFCSASGQLQLAVRITFIVSGIIFILFSILMVTQGLTNLQDSVDSVNESAVDIKEFAAEAQSVIDEGLRSVQSIAVTVRDSLSSELSRESFCPAYPDLDGFPEAAQLRAKADEAIGALSLLDNFLGDQVVGIFQAIDQVGKGALQVEEETSNIDLTDWEAMLFLIPCTIVPALLVAGVILAMFDVHIKWYNRAINWFLLPLFILMVLCCAILSSTWIAIGSANSDFCLPGDQARDLYVADAPDGAVYRMLDRSGYADQTNLVRQVAQFYVQQCQNVSDPFVFMTAYVPTLDEAKATLKDFNDNQLVGDTLAQLSTYCLRDFAEVGDLLAEMITIINSLFVSINRALDLVSCDRIVPVYHLAIYDGACNYSVSAHFWVYSASLVMGAFGLLMILFRSAYKPTVYDSVDSTGEGHEVVYEMPTPNKDNSFESETYPPVRNGRENANAY